MLGIFWLFKAKPANHMNAFSEIYILGLQINRTNVTINAINN